MLYRNERGPWTHNYGLSQLGWRAVAPASGGEGVAAVPGSTRWLSARRKGSPTRDARVTVKMSVDKD